MPPWAAEHWSSRVAGPKYLGTTGGTGLLWGSAIVARNEELDAFEPQDGTWLKELWGSVVLARLYWREPDVAGEHPLERLPSAAASAQQMATGKPETLPREEGLGDRDHRPGNRRPGCG